MIGKRKNHEILQRTRKTKKPNALPKTTTKRHTTSRTKHKQKPKTNKMHTSKLLQKQRYATMFPMQIQPNPVQNSFFF